MRSIQNESNDKQPSIKFPFTYSHNNSSFIPSNHFSNDFMLNGCVISHFSTLMDSSLRSDAIASNAFTPLEIDHDLNSIGLLIYNVLFFKLREALFVPRKFRVKTSSDRTYRRTDERTDERTNGINILWGPSLFWKTKFGIICLHTEVEEVLIRIPDLRKQWNQCSSDVVISIIAISWNIFR